MRECFRALIPLLLTTVVHAQTVDSVNAGRGSVPVYRPAALTPGEPLQLVLSLHGYQQDGAEFENYVDFSPLVELERFLYVLPSGQTNFLGQNYWNAESACCDLFGNDPDDST